MRGIIYFVGAWLMGIATAFTYIAVTFGLREAVSSVGASLLYSFVGFALVVVVIYLPFLFLLKKSRSISQRALAAVGCLLLSVVPIAALNAAYHSTTVVNYENAFMFLLLGVPGAVFGWLWTAGSERHRRAR